MKISEIIDESSLSRLYAHTKKHSVGDITAHRDNRSSKPNDTLTRQLGSYLHSRGYNMTVITGGYVENPGTPDEQEVVEKTFFIVNPTEGDDGGKLERDLIELGELYDQDSILSYRFGDKPTYIGTTHRPDAAPDYGQRYVLTSTEWGNPSGPYFSKIRGRKFAYKESWSWTKPLTNMGRLGASLGVKKVMEMLTEFRTK